jgi:hypothetical protein
MFIVIEGLDRTGKTTLAETIKRRCGGEYMHFNKPEQHPLDEYCRWLDNAPAPHAIVDRYHWGETVWPHVFKRDSEYDSVMQYYTELLLESRGAVMVHAHRSIDQVVKACEEDGEPAQGRQLHLADGLFGITATHSILPVVDYSHGDDVTGLTAYAIQRGFIADKTLAHTRRWVGYANPTVLLVGDEVGPGSDGWSLPFVPYKNTSGYFLMGELANASALNEVYDLPGSGVVKPAVVNSRTPDGSVEDVSSLWRDLGTPAVVALGKRSSGVLETLEIPHETVPHPQWWRRFNRKAGEGSYLAAIQEAAAQ